MTDEIIYANLKFENCYELDNVPEPEVPKEKGVVSIKLLWFILSNVDRMGNTFNLIACPMGLC